MWDLVPWSGIEPELPALGAWCFSHQTTREVPKVFWLISGSIIFKNVSYKLNVQLRCLLQCFYWGRFSRSHSRRYHELQWCQGKAHPSQTGAQRDFPTVSCAWNCDYRYLVENEVGFGRQDDREAVMSSKKYNSSMCCGQFGIRVER